MPVSSHYLITMLENSQWAFKDHEHPFRCHVRWRWTCPRLGLGYRRKHETIRPTHSVISRHIHIQGDPTETSRKGESEKLDSTPQHLEIGWILHMKATAPSVLVCSGGGSSQDTRVSFLEQEQVLGKLTIVSLQTQNLESLHSGSLESSRCSKWLHIGNIWGIFKATGVGFQLTENDPVSLGCSPAIVIPESSQCPKLMLVCRTVLYPLHQFF